MTGAIYLPESGSLPPWVGIVVAVVVLPLLAYRAYRLWRAWRRRR
ncbi:hypothetical protein [Streptomyces ambofaciens]